MYVFLWLNIAFTFLNLILSIPGICQEVLHFENRINDWFGLLFQETAPNEVYLHQFLQFHYFFPTLCCEQAAFKWGWASEALLSRTSNQDAEMKLSTSAEVFNSSFSSLHRWNLLQGCFAQDFTVVWDAQLSTLPSEITVLEIVIPWKLAEEQEAGISAITLAQSHSAQTQACPPTNKSIYVRI